MTTPNPDFSEPFTNTVMPDDLGLIITIDPELIGIIVVAFVIIIMTAVAAFIIGNRRAEQLKNLRRDMSANAIYEHIDFALNMALVAQGVARIDKTRELIDVFEARLGPLMAFNEKHLKAFKVFKKTLGSFTEELQKTDIPSKPPELKVAVGAEELSLIVWKALDKFKTVWSDKANIIKLIIAAQEEMLRDPKPRVINAKQKLKTGPQPAAKVKKEVVQKSTDISTTDTPPDEPPPSPSPSSGRKGKKLPAHKKNMLA